MSKVSFKLLTRDELKNLSDEEAYIYYMEIYGRLRKDSPRYENNKTRLANILNRVIKKILTKITKFDFEISGVENLIGLDYPVLFTNTHQDINDVTNSIYTIPYNVKTLNSDKIKESLKLLLKINGVIFIDRVDQISKNEAKDEMIESLNKGVSINMYPEATLNMSPNRLHLPFHIGAVDIAQQTGKPIIPIIQEYTYKYNKNKEIEVDKVCIHFEKPFFVDKNKDRIEAFREYEEVVETAQWTIFEKNGINKRNAEDIQMYLDIVKKKKEDIKKSGADLDIERRSIYHYDDEFYQYFPVNSREDDYKETVFLNSVNRR